MEVASENIAEFKEMFSIFDGDNDGILSYVEFDSAVRSLGYSLDSEAKKPETIDLPGFLTAMKSVMKNVEDPQREIKLAFEIFPKDDEGCIAPNVFYDVMSKLGEKLTHEEVYEMFHEAGVDDNFPINYENFLKMTMAR